MLLALGCVQSHKCNTNHCPTGITTQDPRLMAGLHVPDKAERVASFQAKTVAAALDITGALGHASPADISGRDVLRRTQSHGLRDFSEIFPWITTPPGSLVRGDAPPAMQAIWSGRSTHDRMMWERA